jgi:hypothetical protein
MPRGTRRELIGILLGDDPYPVLRVADGNGGSIAAAPAAI